MGEIILVVDDERAMVSMIRDALEDEGYQVLTAYDGESVWDLLNRKPDLILLDIMMPGLDGIQVCRWIRDSVSCPILFLSARREVEDRIEGLAVGGDDYITKPFSLEELVARVAAHLRRELRSPDQEKTVLRFGRLLIDLKACEVRYGDRLIPMTAKEFEVIRFLAMHTGQVFSREQIYEGVWGFGEGSDATVTEHIKKIRAKLGAVDPVTTYISTVWGIGYRWEKNDGPQALSATVYHPGTLDSRAERTGVPGIVGGLFFHLDATVSAGQLLRGKNPVDPSMGGSGRGCPPRPGDASPAGRDRSP
ncbi:response regulator transcription factor [Kroppenstedtia eburnea]|uniref:response regulator transcription factor n=1 Tax=Kroppenstedtia eburnea TaxID=714067 RepID=UPI00362BB179